MMPQVKHINKRRVLFIQTMRGGPLAARTFLQIAIASRQELPVTDSTASKSLQSHQYINIAS